MMTMVKVNYIKDAHNNGENYFYPDIPKKLDKKNKDMRKYVKHIKIAKNLIKGNLAAMVVFLKRQKIRFLYP